MNSHSEGKYNSNNISFIIKHRHNSNAIS